MTTTTPRRQMTPEQVFPATEDSSFMTRTTPWARRRRKAGKRPPRTLLPFRKMPPIRLLLEDYTVVAALPFHRIPKRLRRPLFGTLALSRISCRIQLDQMDTLAAITNQRFCRRLASGTRRLPVVGSAGRRRVPEADDGEALVCNRGESSRVHMIKSNPAAYSILPNRLGKMLAPLHWHDYKKKYGKLDDFVAAHTELFVIEGDYIQLREGAQEMIAATAAVARVAAAAAAASPYSSCLPSVAVTPVAQTHRLKKISSLDSKNVVTSTPNANNAHLQSVKQNQQLNGVSFGVSESAIKWCIFWCFGRYVERKNFEQIQGHEWA